MSKQKKIRYIIHDVKPTAQLLFKLPKGDAHGATIGFDHIAAAVESRSYVN